MHQKHANVVYTVLAFSALSLVSITHLETERRLIFILTFRSEIDGLYFFIHLIRGLKQLRYYAFSPNCSYVFRSSLKIFAADYTFFNELSILCLH